MPVRHVSQAGALGFYHEVYELGLACIYHFAGVRGPGNGIGNGSCCAVVRKNGIDPVWGVGYGYGQSQAHNLDPAAINNGGVFNPEHHAERQAHHAGNLNGAGYGNHLFVELPPCNANANGCQTWCANTIPLINVWYLYPNTQTMTATHALGQQAEIAALLAGLG